MIRSFQATKEAEPSTSEPQVRPAAASVPFQSGIQHIENQRVDKPNFQHCLQNPSKDTSIASGSRESGAGQDDACFGT